VRGDSVLSVEDTSTSASRKYPNISKIIEEVKANNLSSRPLKQQQIINTQSPPASQQSMPLGGINFYFF
jgi:hypothetical protein